MAFQMHLPVSEKLMFEPRSFYSNAHKGRSELWVWVTGAALLLFAAYTFTNALWRFAVWLLRLLNFPFQYSFFDAGTTLSLPAVFTHQVTDWTIMTVPVLVALICIQKYIRQRPVLELMTTAPRFRWKRCFAGLGVGFLVIGVSTLLYMMFNYMMPPAITLSDTAPGFLERCGLTWTFNPKLFFGSLPLLLIFIPLNVIMQEMMFRGFLDQGLTRLTGNLILAFMISALLFSVWHIQNYEAAFGTPFYLAGLFFFGLAMSIVTYMDNGMEAAIGVHTASNLFFYLLAGFETPYILPSWLVSFGEPHSTPGTMFGEIAIWAFALFILSKWVYGLDRCPN